MPDKSVKIDAKDYRILKRLAERQRRTIKAALSLAINLLHKKEFEKSRSIK